MIITRISFAIAISILRIFSACCTSLEEYGILPSFVTPSISSAISLPNSLRISSRVTGVSSTTSCKSAAATDSLSIPSCTRRWQAATPRLPAALSTPTTWSLWSGCAARTAPYRQQTARQNKGNLADRLNFDQSFYGNCRLSTICNYAILSK